MIKNWRKKSFVEILKHEAKQFCFNTALHGYRYIILPKRILLERVIWVITVITALTTGLTLVLVVWNTFQENPTSLVTDSTRNPIWFYPFPSITFCNYNIISKKKAYTLAENLDIKPVNQSVDELVKDLQILIQLIYNDDPTIPRQKYDRLQDLLDLNGITVEKALKALAPSCNEYLLKCKWKGDDKRCETLFELILTSAGWCCSFNTFAWKNHNFTGAFRNKAPKVPRKVSGCGYQTGLEVMLRNEPDDYLATQIASFGHKMMVSHPFYYIDWTAQVVLIDMKSLILTGVSPSLTYSTDNIKEMEISKRYCYFPHEKNLFHFQEYNFHNCIVECRINVSKEMCNCVPFIFHNPNGTYHSHRICNLRDLACLDEYQSAIFSSMPGFNYNLLPKDYKYGSENSECWNHCLPDCDDVLYNIETSIGSLNRDFSYNQQNLYGGMAVRNQSVMRVFFNDLVAVRNRRDLIFSWPTLFAYYGGLMGLFVGFSFISLIELLYFFTIRLIADTAKNNRIEKQQVIRRDFVKYENLDPRKLFLENQNRLIRFRSNSNTAKK